MTSPSERPAPGGSERRWSARLRSEIAAHTIAWAYLVLALSFGLALVVIVPPFQTNDAPEHYARSWAIAEGQLFVGEGGAVELPSNVSSLFDDMQAGYVMWGSVPYDAGATLSRLGDEVSADSVEHVTVTGTYSPVGYLPQALGIDLVRLFGGSPLMGLYVASLFMLLASAALTFWAVRLTPFGAPVLALVALLPMSITLCASLNPSALLNAGALLWIALVLKAAKSTDVRTSLAAILAVTSIVLLTVKPGYVALALVILVVPRGAYPSTRRYWATTIACIAGTAAVTAALLVSAPQLPAEVLQARSVGVGDAAGQIRFVLEHPWAFTKVLAGSFSGDALVWLKELVGAPGRGRVVLSDAAILVALLGALLLMMRSATREVRLATWQRAGFLGVAAVSAAIIPASFYVLAMPIAAGMIVGVQGRYFLPIVPCLLIGLYGLRLQHRWTPITVVSACALLMAVMTIVALVRHFYAW